MKPKLLEQIVGAGLAVSLNFLVGCQVLEKSVKDFYIPRSPKEVEQEIQAKVNEQIRKAAIKYILSSYGEDYKVTRNPTFVTSRQKEILSKIPQQIPGDYKPKYQTSAHRALALEQEFGATVEDYKTLDDLLDKIIPNIPIKSTYSKKDAFKIFKIIASTLTEYEKDENTLLNFGLKEKIFDCDNFSIIYYAVGEVLNLPIKMVNVMDHVFVRWDFGNDHLNWDNMWGQEENKAFLDWVYKVSFGLNTLFVELNQKEIIAISYLNRGIYWNEQKEYQKSLKELNTAIQLYPNFLMAIYDMGYDFLGLEDYPRALEVFSSIIKKYPDFANGYNARGLVYDVMGLYPKAIEDFTKTIELDPKSDVAYQNRAKVWEKLGNAENAAKDHRESFLLKYKQNEEDGIIWVE